MDDQIAARARVIAEDDVHGASWLARQAVEALADAVRRGEDPLAAGRALAAARPAMGAIAGALGRVLAAGRTDEQLLEECQALLERRDRASHSIAVLLKPEIGGRVMTHSASATVHEALLHAQPSRVVCTVTGPQEEGRRFAADLGDTGLAVDLVADDDAPSAVATVDVLLVGADTVYRDGSLVNKTGTCDLAGAANEAGVPVLVACETFKLAPCGPPEKAAEDAFDITPADRIQRYATDEGVFAPVDIAALVDQTPFLREGYELLHAEDHGSQAAADTAR
jgi:ribose 1,5-bisphosphate isomerase